MCQCQNSGNNPSCPGLGTVSYGLWSFFWCMVSQWMVDLQNVLSLVVLLRSCKLKAVASFTDSIHLILGLLSLLPSSVSGIVVFSSKSCLLIMCSKHDSLAFIIFCFQKKNSGLIWSRTHWFIFLAVQSKSTKLFFSTYCRDRDKWHLNTYQVR